MGNVRIMFTAATADGKEHDLIMHADARTKVSDIAEAFGAERLYAGGERLVPTALAVGAIRSGYRIGLDHPTQPAWTADGGGALPLTPSHNGSTLLVRRPPRSRRLPPPPQEFTLPERPRPSGYFRRRHVDAYRAARASVEEAADQARVAHEAWWQAEYPDPVGLFGIAAGLDWRLWERRPGDPDFLTFRVGTSECLSSVSVRDPAGAEPKTLLMADAPATVTLTGEHGALGIACPADTSAELIWGGPERPGTPARDMCRWIAAQLAVLRSPRDIRICVLTDPSARADWAWVRWLPHCRPLREVTAPAWIGTRHWPARVSELLSIISERLSGRDSGQTPVIVVVFDGWKRFRSDPHAVRVLRDGPKVGIYAICLDTAVRSLPAECHHVIEPDAPGNLERLRVRGPDSGTGLPDRTGPTWCEELARFLAPLEDGSTADDHGIPAANSLLDLLDLVPLVPETITRRWGPGGDWASTTIGESIDGPFEIDLRRDGPHVIITGAAGSGKSELLQAIAASFAVAGSPDAITFLFVDHKGGSTFLDCAGLPHSAGLITDLDSREAARVLSSLTAELRRRERLLRSVGARDATDYTAVWDDQLGLRPMPRLLIMVDEFADLDRELPGFIADLSSIAQRGRGLGVHLFLATRHIEDAISAGIRDVASLRIALRSDDAADSRDIPGTPDAASIPVTLPGRGYVRVGRRPAILVQFTQVSGPAPRSHESPRITPVGWEDLGEPEQLVPAEPAGPDARTTLAALVAAARQANDAQGIPPPHRPWLPGLPSAVALEGLPLSRPDGGSDLPRVPFALEDLPSEQVQRAAVIDFASFGHLLAVGDRLSGRSQLLRTIAGTTASAISCADVHIYGIDLGDNALLPLAGLPHCGAVATPAQSGHASRLVDRLGRELDRRKVLLAETRVASIGEQRRQSPLEQRLPHVLVMLDRWERLTEAMNGDRPTAVADTIMRIARQGPMLGMHLVVTGDLPILRSPLGTAAKDTLILRLADRADYAAAGMRPRDIPDDIPDGRAFRIGSGTELQIALLDGDPTEVGQAAALRAIAADALRRDAAVPLARRPFGVETADLVSDRFDVGGAHGRPVGREDVLTWLLDRHAAGGPVALLGPRRAGKTWVLRELQRRLKDGGHREVHGITIQKPSGRIDTKDELARVLDRGLRDARYPADDLLNRAQQTLGTEDRLTYLLDEVGRLSEYGPAAVSWLRDLGQAGAWLVYTGTEKDWQDAQSQALKAPGSSFGNDVDARPLGPLNEQDAAVFLTGTAANLQVDLDDETARRVLDMVGSWPFYLQVVGDAVVRAVQAKNMRPLWDRQALADLITARLLDGWMPHFKARWKEVGRAGRAALLDSPGEQPDLLTPGQREDLRAAGLLRPGDHWLGDRPFFGWISRNATALRDEERRP